MLMNPIRVNNDHIKSVVEAAVISDNPVVQDALAMLLMLTQIAEAEKIEYLKHYPLWPQYHCGCCC